MKAKRSLIECRQCNRKRKIKKQREEATQKGNKEPHGAPGEIARPPSLSVGLGVAGEGRVHRRRNRGGGGGGGTGGMCPPKFHKLLYKLLTTLCVVSDCAPPNQKVFPTPLELLVYQSFIPGVSAPCH